MTLFNLKAPPYKPSKPTIISWNDFRGGLNTLLNDTEIKGNELAQADNLLLSGAGVPSKRWGTQLYFQACETGCVRGITGYYNGTTKEILSLTDDGLLTRKSGASYEIITGASWPSGYPMTAAQLNNFTYIVSYGRELVRYNGSALVNYATIAMPVMSSITNFSGASGLGELTEVSYRVSAEGQVGETIASTAISLASVQADPEQAVIRISWAAVSAASGDLKGYVIYGREPGDESFLARVTSYTTTYDDDGTDVPSDIVLPPTADSTGGYRAKYITAYKDRLIITGIVGDPNRVVISGRVSNEDRFHWTFGGGSVLIDPDSGDNITGIAVLREKIIIFKERSVWEMSLTTTTFGNYTLLDPTYNLITSSHGCVSHDTICAVEDDLFFLSRKGVYSIGFRPNLLNILSTNEVSAKVRDKMGDINETYWDTCSAAYVDYKYILSYPQGGSVVANQMIMFDRERLAWMGPWYYGGNKLYQYYDGSNIERFVIGSNASPYVAVMSSAYTTDDGTAIDTRLRTRKEDFGSWNLFKTLKDIFLQFEQVKGEVNVDVFIEERSGNVATAKNFTITSTSGESGWGTFMWGNFQFGDSEEAAGSGDISEILRWINTNKTGRSVQVQVTTTDASADYKLLGIKMEAQVQGKGSIPASYRV